MIITNRSIPRRTFLRGAGALLGLPMLHAMGKVLPGSSPAALAGTSSARNVQAPVRMACIYFPNGVWEKTWFPKTAGADYELPFALEPLAAHKKDMMVFSGLDKAQSHDGDGHYAKTANFLTGLHVKKTPGKDISVGSMSLDQLCAQKVGQFTPLPSIELGVDPVISGIDTAVGYTRLYGCYISWRAPGVPVAREISPQNAYERLFGVIRASKSANANKKQMQDECNLLDLVFDDAKSLRSRLGRDDQSKLDEYLESVRDIERRLAFFSHADPRDWHPEALSEHNLAAPKGAPRDHQEHVRLMLDLMALAFQTDSTRVGTFMFANDVSSKDFGQLIPGTSGSHHEFSHHQNKAEKFEPYSKINRWHSEQLAYFLNKLASVREGERTLLDNSMVLFGSSMSDGNRHDPNNLPIVLAGRGGGSFDTGKYVACPKSTPLCNLYVSMLERMGIAVEKFGDSSAKLLS